MKKISLLDHITRKILDFPDKINDIKQLQSFLGLLNCATDFAEKRRSLTAKLKGTKKLIHLVRQKRNIDHND